MSIEVTVEDKARAKDRPFPKVMVNEDGLVVLFHKEDCGIILACGGRGYKTGDYATNWCMHLFKDFTGKITMECK